jgi:alginate O-acetyltransferase complex protein AlgI
VTGTWLTWPTPLFNPLTALPPLSPREILAGPFGLLAFVPLVPLVLLVARRNRALALVASGLVWMVGTLSPGGAAVVLGWTALAAGWVLLLGTGRRRGRLSERGMITLTWIGLSVLVLPFWWDGSAAWFVPSRTAPLHNVGLAYLMLRLVAWGVDWARNPQLPLRLSATAGWLLYAPCMRLGPVMLREEFLRRYEAWDPRRSPDFVGGLRRLGWLVVGGVLLGFVAKQIPGSLPGGSFLSCPEQYGTGALVRALYLVPVQVYLLLWTYNELAAVLGLWIGLPVDNNFNWLPLATSVRDFWRRWHVTLGAWLRAYVYIPLGGNRRHVGLNNLAVFGLCGVWHGAAWSFVAWSLTQTVALTLQRWWDKWRGQAGAGEAGRRTWLGWVGTVVCWLATMQYQVLTVFVFVDFEHCGWRLLRELGRRFLSAC